MIRIVFWCGLLGWFFSLSSFLIAASPEIVGDWVGSFELSKGGDSPFRMTISKDQAGLKGSIDAPFAGIRKKAVESLSSNGKEIHFDLPVEEGNWKFEGKLIDDSLQGQHRQGDQTGSFRLIRIHELNPQELKRYFGIYQLGPKRTVYIRTWDELGENQLTYLDNEGNIAPLYASTKGDFFSGNGLWMALPPQARIKFESDGTLIWSDKDSGQQKGKKVSSYQEEDLYFQSGQFKLAGTLVTPAGKGPHPAVVFVHGSGRVTRDFMGPLAYHFVQNGIAVLSYDKRGSGKSEGRWLSAGFPDLAQDARAAVNLLKNRKGIDPARIGLLGISQGGWIGPMAAAENPDVAFLIMISAPAVTPAQQEVSRMSEELKVEGVPEKTVAEQVEKLKGELNSLRDEKVQKELAAEIQKLEKEGKQELLAESDPANPQFLLWYAGLMDHDPVPVLKKLKCPVLAIYGEIDRGVPASESQPILETALKQSRDPQYTVNIFPGGNHALLESTTGSMKEFPFLKRFVHGFLDLMVNWVKTETFRKNSSS